MTLPYATLESFIRQINITMDLRQQSQDSSALNTQTLLRITMTYDEALRKIMDETCGHSTDKKQVVALIHIAAALMTLTSKLSEMKP
jgi:hypothetical protein